jgi:6,7-dimethyl-8-ribityllumazine synthase
MLQNQEKKIRFDATVAKKLKIAIIRTDYHKELIDSLEQYCIQTLIQNGVSESNITVFSAPGSWEIPLLAQKVAKSHQFDAIITFGIIVKGETYHFEMIANECAHALMQLSLDYSIPIAMEVLAVFDIQQARERADKNDKNKGIEAATAVLKALSGLKQIELSTE